MKKLAKAENIVELFNDQLKRKFVVEVITRSMFHIHERNSDSTSPDIADKLILRFVRNGFSVEMTDYKNHLTSDFYIS